MVDNRVTIYHQTVRSRAVEFGGGMIVFDSEGKALVTPEEAQQLIALYPQISQVEAPEQVVAKSTKGPRKLKPLRGEAFRPAAVSTGAASAMIDRKSGLIVPQEDVIQGTMAPTAPLIVEPVAEPVFNRQAGIPLDSGQYAPPVDAEKLMITARENVIIPLIPGEEIFKRLPAADQQLPQAKKLVVRFGTKAAAPVAGKANGRKRNPRVKAV
jgi:hypothetical protein